MPMWSIKLSFINGKIETTLNRERAGVAPVITFCAVTE